MVHKRGNSSVDQATDERAPVDSFLASQLLFFEDFKLLHLKLALCISIYTF